MPESCTAMFRDKRNTPLALWAAILAKHNMHTYRHLRRKTLIAKNDSISNCNKKGKYFYWGTSKVLSSWTDNEYGWILRRRLS
jgi:hypothetical protein